MRLLLSASSFNSHYGGPARSVPNLGLALSRLGMDVGLWAPDGSASQSPLIQAYDAIQKLDGPLQEAWNTFGRVDVLHDNGIWNLHHLRLSQLAERMGAPRMVSTRGMLEPWAMNYKPIRKKLAWWGYQHKSLREATAIHVTAPSEGAEVSRFGLNQLMFDIPNGVDIPSWECVIEHRTDSVDDRFTCLFLSRLHPKKGLPMLLEAWSKIMPNGWRLVISGPDEDGHLSSVKAYVSKLKLDGVVHFAGALEGIDKEEALAKSDLFVLPTYSENFGIVVAEALAHGCPVITTHGAPWSILEEERCGWWVPISVESLADALGTATRLSRAQRLEMGDRGRSVVESRFAWDGIAKRFVDAYEQVAKMKPVTRV